jgi:hypothetical protein
MIRPTAPKWWTVTLVCVGAFTLLLDNRTRGAGRRFLRRRRGADAHRVVRVGQADGRSQPAHARAEHQHVAWPGVRAGDRATMLWR